MYDRMPPKLPFYWNSVIPATLDTALTFDEMQSKIVWTVNKILENQYLTVPYLISLGTEYTTTSISIKGILFQNYTPLQVDKEFVINGMKDGTYYINVFNDAANTEAGKPPVQSNDLLFLSTEYMPKNCTSLYVFDILNGNIVGNSIRYNDLYTEMHNADPNAHQALFEAVYNKIEEESDGLHNEIVTETNRAKQAEQQLQDNIDNESTARQQADTTLQNNINAEKTAREQADTALGERITAETTARQQADTNLQNSINAEKTAREQADTALRNSLDEEIGDRIDGEDAINAKINAHIQNKNNPHNVTVDQIGNVVKSIKGSNQTVLYDNVTLTGIRGINTLGDNQIISIGGPMYDAPTDNSVDVNYVGITSLSSNIEYASTKQGLPSKTGWLYLVSYKIDTAVKKVIYNTDGTAYCNNGGVNDTWNLIQSNDIVKSINDFVGAITLTGENGNIINNNNNTITVSGAMISNTNGLVIENNTNPGIYSLSDSAFYTSNTSGLPNKAGWMYLILYKTITQSKYVIYNLDGTAYYKASNTSEWVEIQHSGSGTAGVSSINSLTGALTINGDQGVEITTTPYVIQVRGQYYVLSQNTSINGTLRPGITAAGNYAFTNTPQNKSVMYVITVDYKSNEYIYAQYAVCFDYSVYRRLSNADGSTATEWYYNGVTDINATKGSIIFEARNGASISKSGNTFTVLGPIARSPNLSLNTNNSVGIFSFDYDSSPVGMPTEATNAYVMLQVMTDGDSSIETYTQLVIDKDDGKMFTRTKNNNGSQATAWKLSSYSPALDNQTITLDSLAPNLGIQNLTLQLEQYRGVTFKAKFYVPFSISNSTTPLTQVSLWSLPAGWAFDEEQNIPVYFFSTSPRANLFGYLHCVDNYIEVEFSDTLTSISAGWILRCCNSDLYLVKTSQ